MIFQKIIFAISSLFLLLFPTLVLAADDILDKLHKIAASIGFSTIGSGDDVQVTIGQQIGFLLFYIMSFLGVIFMLLIIYAGFKWMTARGNEDQVEKSKKIIEASVIGIFIIALAYAFTQFIGFLFIDFFKY